MTHWFDWQETRLVCAGCGWSGVGRDAQLREMFDGGAEYGCPTCGRIFAFVAYPTHDEMRTDPRAAPVDRLAAGIREERFARHEQTMLRSTHQLPDLDPPPTTLAWDIVDGSDGDTEVHVRHDERVIWRELAFYENHRRFAEIAVLLKRKYGAALIDLAPTERSWGHLLGDTPGADADVQAARDAMR